MTDHKELLSPDVLTKAAAAVEASATVWAGFSMLDAKTCIQAAIAASQPTVQGGASVDTVKFWNLVGGYLKGEPTPSAASGALLAYIDAHIASQVAKATEDKTEYANQCIEAANKWRDLATQAEKARGVPTRDELRTGLFGPAVEGSVTFDGVFRRTLDRNAAVVYNARLAAGDKMYPLVDAAPQAPHAEPVSDAAVDDCFVGGKCGVGGYCDNCHHYAAPAVAEGDVRDAALEEAAKLTDSKADNLERDCGQVDPETGTLEFKSVHAEDAYNAFRELAEDIRVLRTAPAKPSVDFHNVTGVERYSDQSVKLTFSSCHQASLFERAADATLVAAHLEGK